MARKPLSKAIMSSGTSGSMLNGTSGRPKIMARILANIFVPYFVKDFLSLLNCHPGFLNFLFWSHMI